MRTRLCSITWVDRFAVRIAATELRILMNLLGTEHSIAFLKEPGEACRLVFGYPWSLGFNSDYNANNGSTGCSRLLPNLIINGSFLIRCTA
jgi:hypothetical protein